MDDTEERSKIDESFGIQLNESPDIRDIPVIFLFGWLSTMGKLRTKCYQEVWLEVKTRRVGTFHSTYPRLNQLNIPLR